MVSKYSIDDTGMEGSKDYFLKRIPYRRQTEGSLLKSGINGSGMVSHSLVCS
jgi:hypothetical protein